MSWIYSLHVCCIYSQRICSFGGVTDVPCIYSLRICSSGGVYVLCIYSLRICSFGGVYVPCIYSLRICSFGGVYVPCIYSLRICSFGGVYAPCIYSLRICSFGRVHVPSIHSLRSHTLYFLAYPAFAASTKTLHHPPTPIEAILHRSMLSSLLCSFPIPKLLKRGEGDMKSQWWDKKS